MIQTTFLPHPAADPERPGRACVLVEHDPKRQAAMLRRLVLDFHAAIEDTDIARLCFCSSNPTPRLHSQITNDALRATVREIVLSDGDWQAARRSLLASHVPGIKKTIAWADQLLQKEVLAAFDKIVRPKEGGAR